MIKILFFTLFASLSIYAEDPKYYHILEPILPEFTPTLTLENLPPQEQVLITRAILEYCQEKELYTLELLPAFTDVLNQKTFLEMELKNILLDSYSPELQKQIETLDKVINEKNTMLTNLKAIEYRQNQQLYNLLKTKIITILNQLMIRQTYESTRSNRF
ncbi:MAG: hypothetical protein ACRCWI_07465 [Brevinema sp.]